MPNLILSHISLRTFKMGCLPFNLLSKFTRHAAGADYNNSAKAVAARREAKIRFLMKSLHKNLKASASVNRGRAEKLYDFIEAEEARFGLMKNTTYTATDLADLKKSLLPFQSQTLIDDLYVGDNYDGMTVVKRELYRVAFLKNPAGLSPQAVEKVYEAGGDLGKCTAP